MAKKQSKKKRKHSSYHHYFIIAGVVILAAAVLLLKEKPQAPEPVSSIPPEAQLEQALAAGQPVLAFFHSYTCYQCTVMMEIVADVYPEFSGSITLVDVDVYDDQNISLLNRAQIRTIPTVILFDRLGQGQVYLGVMEPGQLREGLNSISRR
jgi:thioredoxin-like negative regulator of GroEL